MISIDSTCFMNNGVRSLSFASAQLVNIFVKSNANRDRTRARSLSSVTRTMIATFEPFKIKSVQTLACSRNNFPRKAMGINFARRVLGF